MKTNMRRSLRRLVLLIVAIGAVAPLAGCTGHVGVGVSVGVPIGAYPGYVGFGPRWY